MKEYICIYDEDEMQYIPNPYADAEELIRCKDCGQREYGCSTFIDHNQIYGFCAWAWKAEREEE